MENQLFKEGDWVKKKDGTKGMTVVDYLENGQVKCRLKGATGEDLEENFLEQDLVPLSD